MVAGVKKLVNDLFMTRGAWDGAKIGSWGAGAVLMSSAIHWVFLQHHELNYIAFASASSAIVAGIIGGHYFHAKADSQFPQGGEK